MDFFSEAPNVSTSASAYCRLESIVAIVVAIAIMWTEVERHTADMPQSIGGIRGCIRSVRTILRQNFPEVAGLAACLACAGVLRMQGVSGSEVDAEAWAKIMQEWPTLLTADSLLALQAALRVLVLVSAIFRGIASSPMSQEAALFMLSALVARVALAKHSSAYLLDGPLGGSLPVMCELASVPLLAVLCKGVSRQTLMASTVTIATAAWVASRNRLSLGEDALADGLFIFAHIAELIAAFAFFFRTLLLGVGSSDIGARFAHILMPLQQVLAAYYFVQAFEYTPELVGSGHPFEVLQGAGVAQLAAYVGAAVFFLAEYLETPHSQPTEAERDTGSQWLYDAMDVSAQSMPRAAAVGVTMPRAAAF